MRLLFTAFLLLFVTAAFALHDPSDPVSIGILRDGSAGRGGVAAYFSLRVQTAGTASMTTDTATVDTAISFGKIGANYYQHRTYIQTDSLEKYSSAFAVDSGNTARIDSVVMKIYATGAIDSCGCPAPMYLLAQPLCDFGNASNTPITFGTTTYNDWYTIFNAVAPPLNPIPFVCDSAYLDTNAFGSADTARLTFTIKRTDFMSQLECAIIDSGGSATAPGLYLSIVSYFDFALDSISVSDNNTAHMVKFLFNGGSAQPFPPTIDIYWTEVVPISPDSSTWHPFAVIPYSAHPYSAPPFNR